MTTGGRTGRAEPARQVDSGSRFPLGVEPLGLLFQALQVPAQFFSPVVVAVLVRLDDLLFQLESVRLEAVDLLLDFSGGALDGRVSVRGATFFPAPETFPLRTFCRGASGLLLLFAQKSEKLPAYSTSVGFRTSTMRSTMRSRK